MREIIEVEQKCLYYLDTFFVNSARPKAQQIILDCLKQDAVEQKMETLRSKNRARIYRENMGEVDPYETGAQAFYRRYGTVGEF